MRLLSSRTVSAPWTEEDGEIFQRGGRRLWPIARRTTGLLQDIRDADLMLIARHQRMKGWMYIVLEQYSDPSFNHFFGGVLP